MYSRWTPDLNASTSQVLGLNVCATMASWWDYRDRTQGLMHAEQVFYQATYQNPLMYLLFTFSVSLRQFHITKSNDPFSLKDNICLKKFDPPKSISFALFFLIA